MRLHAEADTAAVEVAELEAGDLVEAAADVDVVRLSPEGGWLLVRSPLEDKVDVMSDKPLQYQEGWLALVPSEGMPNDGAVNAGPCLERAEVQLGDRVAARVNVESHPVLDVLKKLPPWQNGLPGWMVTSVSEIYTGKIGGIVKRGRFVVQRPSGAMPERIATKAALLILPRDRARQTAVAGFIGLGISVALGTAIHAHAWMRGHPVDSGLMAWTPLVGWLTLIVVFITPFAILPCYGFANSQASTACVVAWLNLLLYCDLFSE